MDFGRKLSLNEKQILHSLLAGFSVISVQRLSHWLFSWHLWGNFSRRWFSQADWLRQYDFFFRLWGRNPKYKHPTRYRPNEVKSCCGQKKQRQDHSFFPPIYPYKQFLFERSPIELMIHKSRSGKYSSSRNPAPSNASSEGRGEADEVRFFLLSLSSHYSVHLPREEEQAWGKWTTNLQKQFLVDQLTECQYRVVSYFFFLILATLPPGSRSDGWHVVGCDGS